MKKAKQQGREGGKKCRMQKARTRCSKVKKENVRKNCRKKARKSVRERERGRRGG